ncbi:DUF4265 domain-containing protein [Flavobacterium sp. Fl-318]|uniref:DUF4265 domain-containing protein n=1 Tax=Flavobacterium cupriresistens TaxID=2893885 RepID=A0ABU4R582_9FLAO|nr:MULTISPECIES: DUF4265 domain-containing protein [unclassified Flavobacterium]MDX6187745.1 DUF4265 domain-containing protein [Flavobacterium sp. Fl-318]UFH42332.1 DUF4265 domain-containing protein [Flavobacterium sp. F-323]
MNNNIKVAFVQKINEAEFETETIWCERNGENFVVDNIPFVAKRISLGDTIKAEYDEDDKMYYFDDFVKISGNSTIRIFLYDDNKIESTREWLNKNDCESEVLLVRSIVAVNIPQKVYYPVIRDFLEEGEKKGNWVYEESCLEHEY